jgi:DNA repair protein RAD7
MNNLTHLSLEFYKQFDDCVGTVNCCALINSIGASLRTLSLATIHYLTDDVLREIHDNCQNLSKLRLTDNSSFTDDGFAKLFTGWLNPPLVYLDLHKCRHIDASEPRENPNRIGLGSAGFEALMAHSGCTLKHLNVHSCRHISREAFKNVFGENKTYPEMLEIDVSFCQSVNDFVVGSIFGSCPNLKTLKVFGNFGVREVRVPKGKILIGVPNALGMQIEGTEEEEGRVI